MVTLKNTGGTVAHRSLGRRVEHGETVDVDEDTASRLAENYNYERVEGDESEDGESEDVEPPFDPTEYTVDELDSRLADNDYTDDELAALRDAEESGEGRTSALDVIGEHRE